jgi:hypothetical protein
LVFQREVSRVEQVQLGVRQILQVGARTLRREDHVVLAPHDQRRRLPLAEELLELRIQRGIRAVVVEEIELNLDVAGTIEQRLILDPGARIDTRAIRNAVEVL